MNETGDNPHQPDPDEPDEPDEPDGAERDEGMFWRVAPGDAFALVAAYRTAVRQAEELTAALATAELADEVIAVTAGLDAAGEPLMRGVVTLADARRLGEFLAAGGPPPPGCSSATANRPGPRKTCSGASRRTLLRCSRE